MGNPLRAVICMLLFLCANIVGTTLFVATPLFTGRSIAALMVNLVPVDTNLHAGTLISQWLLRLTDALNENSVVEESNIMFQEVHRDRHMSVQGRAVLPPGHSFVFDIGTLALGYALLAAI